MHFFDKTQPIKEFTVSDPEYPYLWKGFSDAPPAVYAAGNIRLLEGRKFVIVGSRRIPAPAVKLGMKISKTLSEEFVIVTGTADGGDTAAIEGALSGNGRVICVLAGGFSAIPQSNIDLLREVASRGLLISPHPYETEVRSYSYEYRNKLLAALGAGVLVLGASEKSGALITARYAKEAGKPVFALPYFPGGAAGEGCNALLKKGAYLAENAFDIAEKMGINLTEPKRRNGDVTLTPDELNMLTALRNLSESHVTALAECAGMPVFKARAVLSGLEVKGYAVNLGGNRYAPL